MTICFLGVVAFLYGREVQPRIGPLNIKIFCVIHLAMLGWAALLTVIAFQAYVTGKGNAAFYTVAVLQSVYILDIILFQVCICMQTIFLKLPFLVPDFYLELRALFRN
jgi:hypothetical protein